MELTGEALTLHGVAAVLTTVGGFFAGQYRTKTRFETTRGKQESLERDRLFEHYNQLIVTTREMNHGLREEVGTVRNQMQALQIQYATERAEAVRDREQCRVENERLKSELRHLRADLAQFKEELSPKRDDKEERACSLPTPPD